MMNGNLDIPDEVEERMEGFYVRGDGHRLALEMPVCSRDVWIAYAEYKRWKEQQ